MKHQEISYEDKFRLLLGEKRHNFFLFSVFCLEVVCESKLKLKSCHFSASGKKREAVLQRSLDFIFYLFNFRRREMIIVIILNSVILAKLRI